MRFNSLPKILAILKLTSCNIVKTCKNSSQNNNNSCNNNIFVRDQIYFLLPKWIHNIFKFCNNSIFRVTKRIDAIARYDCAYCTLMSIKSQNTYKIHFHFFLSRFFYSSWTTLQQDKIFPMGFSKIDSWTQRELLLSA